MSATVQWASFARLWLSQVAALKGGGHDHLGTLGECCSRTTFASDRPCSEV